MEFAPLVRLIKANVAAGDGTIDSVSAACREGYQPRLRTIREMSVLNRYGWTESELYEYGPHRLDSAKYSRSEFNSSASTGVTLLVAAYDPRGHGHILTVDQREAGGSGL